MPPAYYNDTEPFVCDWLAELMADGLIAPGDIDRRSIADIDPADLRGYTRCHFFAGIGGWDLALQLAGWPDEREVWTGSCPCQPFSSAGKRKGTDDERHLWPAFSALIAERRPATVFGEQVASSDGRAWLSGVFDDLDGMGYRAAGADLCAAGIGAPHIRQRLWWVADADLRRRNGIGERNGESATRGTIQPRRDDDGRGSDDGGTGHPDRGDGNGRQSEPIGEAVERTAADRASEGHRGLEHASSLGQHRGCADGPGEQTEVLGARPQVADRLGDGERTGLERLAGDGDNGHEPGRVGPDQARSVAPAGWNDCGLVRCVEPDREVYRRAPLKPSLFPLAHGVSNRVGTLRGAGNAIVPPLAAEFVAAYLGAE